MIAQLDHLYSKIRPTKVIPRLLSYALFEGRPVTTRGRWINPLVFAHFAVEKRLPRLKRVEKPIFVLGTGRSGTTILGMVLSMHREVAYLNEPKALWHSIYPHEDVIGSYSQGPARHCLDDNDATFEVTRNAHRLFGAYLTVTLSKRLVDKYPELIFRVPFVKAIFPDAKFLFLARDGWSTCFSITRWSKEFGNRLEGEKHDWWGVNSRKWQLLVEQVMAHDPELSPHLDEIQTLQDHSQMAAVEWIVSMREGLNLLDHWSQDVKLVRYEELSLAPRRVLAELLEFCELPVDEKCLEYGERAFRPARHRSSFHLHPAIAPAFANIWAASVMPNESSRRRPWPRAKRTRAICGGSCQPRGVSLPKPKRTVEHSGQPITLGG